MVESLRRDQSQLRKVKKLAVTLNSFNQRLTTIRQFLGMQFDIYLNSMEIGDMRYDRIRDQKMRVLRWLESSFINAPPANFNKSLGLTIDQTKSLINCLDPNNEEMLI